MTKTQASVTIDRAVEEVWRFITDVSNGPKWDKGLTEWRQTSTGPFGIGTTFLAIHPKLTYAERIVEYEPNRKLSLEITSGPARGTVGILSMEDVGGKKTRFTESTDYKFGGIYKLVGAFVTRTARNETESRVANVKRLLESEAKL